MLYERARAEAETATGREREARRQAADSEYRDATLGWPRESASDPLDRGSPRGQIALVERRFDDAQRHAEEALVRAPDLFEAREVVGRVLIARAIDVIDAGKRGEADCLLGEAD